MFISDSNVNCDTEGQNGAGKPLVILALLNVRKKRTRLLIFRDSSCMECESVFLIFHFQNLHCKDENQRISHTVVAHRYGLKRFSAFNENRCYKRL